MKRHHPAEYTAKPETWKLIKSNRVLYLFLVPAFVYFGIFAYAPMYGVQIAFKNFVPSKGIWGSEWTGLTYFTMFLQNPKFWDYVRNTVYLSLYSLIAGFPVPIILALILNDIKNSKLKRISQTLTYMPHFISIVVLVGMMSSFFSPQSGFVNTAIKALEENLSILWAVRTGSVICTSGRESGKRRLGFDYLSGRPYRSQPRTS